MHRNNFVKPLLLLPVINMAIQSFSFLAMHKHLVLSFFGVKAADVAN